MDRAKIATAVADRHAELGRTWARVSTDAGLDQATVWKVRHGHRVSDATLRKLDAALGWPSGTLEAVGRGEPVPQTTPTDAEVVELLAEIRDVLGSLTRHLGVA